MHAKVFERIVAGVAHQLFNRIGPVRFGAPAHRRLVHLDQHPVIARVAHAGVAGEGQTGGVSSGAFIRQNGGQRFDDQVNNALDLVEPRFTGCRRNGVEDAAQGGRDLHRAERAFVLRDVFGVGVGVQQQRAKGEVAGDFG